MPLAHAVRRAGHRVAVAAPPEFAPTIERHDLPALAAGTGRLPRRLDRLFADLGAIQVEREAWLFANWVGGLRCQLMASDLIALAGAWKPDLIVREGVEYGGCLAAEALGIPHVTVRPRPVPSGLSYRLRERVTPVLERRRRELGLAPDPDGQMCSRYLELAFLPREFFGATETHSPRTRYFDFGLRGLQADPGADPAPVPAGAAPARVYVSLGTLWYSEPGVMETLVGALCAQPLQLLVSAGNEAVAARLREVVAREPARREAVTIHASVDQLEALRRCDVFVTHGGINSVREAAILGVPMVVVPLTGDQPFNAERCAALGVARRVGPGERGGPQVREAVCAVLEDDAYRDASQRLQRAIAALAPVEQAVAALEELARRAQPPARPAGRDSSVAPD